MLTLNTMQPKPEHQIGTDPHTLGGMGNRSGGGGGSVLAVSRRRLGQGGGRTQPKQQRQD